MNPSPSSYDQAARTIPAASRIKTLGAILAATAIGAGAGLAMNATPSPAAPANPTTATWQRTAFEDGSVAFDTALHFPKRATDVKVNWVKFGRTATGQPTVRIRVSYCQRFALCDDTQGRAASPDRR